MCWTFLILKRKPIRKLKKAETGVHVTFWSIRKSVLHSWCSRKRRLESALLWKYYIIFWKSGVVQSQKKSATNVFKWKVAQDKIKIRKTWRMLSNGLGLDLTYKTLEIFESNVFWIRCVIDLHNVHLGF